MSLPRKKNLAPLPEIENYSSQEQIIQTPQGEDLIEEVEDDIITTELTDEDFLIAENVENNNKDEDVKEEIAEERPVISETILSSLIAPDKKEKKQIKMPKLKFKSFDLFKNMKKQDISSNNSLKFNPKIVIGIVGLFVIVSFIIFKTFRSEPQESNNYSLKYIKDEYSGVVFNIKSNKNSKVKIQRVYKEDNGTLVVCETEEEQELLKDQYTEVFASCLNNTEDVKDTNKKMIEDSIVEIK